MIGLIRPIRRIGLIILFSWDSVFHFKIITKNCQKNKRQDEIQIFVGGKLHQLNDNQYFNKIRYTDFLSNLGRNLVEIDFLFEV